MPNSVQREAIDRAVTAGDAALLERWKLCVDAWRLAGHSPVNIAGVLDWFKAGGPPAAGSQGRGERQARRRVSRWDEEELAAQQAADAFKEWPDPDEADGPVVIDLDEFYSNVPARAGPGAAF
ncbi:MAG: hypothetical protein AB1566_08370 [Chloroflexota bacterium]